MAEEGTFTKNEEVERKAGSGASSTALQETYTNQYIKEAEGWIMSQVKKENLVSDYADYSDEVKELLRLIASNIAAIFVINYDQTGWSRRSDADIRVQTLWGTAKSAMEDLDKILIKK